MIRISSAAAQCIFPQEKIIDEIESWNAIVRAAHKIKTYNDRKQRKAKNDKSN